ncbi:MAG TPA: UvrB/UvrC motif-containing protein, partial [Gemmatales bacterium]|nr:UvrB/UvrC motif-containing protein [Gemmatales bacterium]
AEALEFEKAAALRDRMAKIRGEKVASPQIKKPKRSNKRGFRG